MTDNSPLVVEFMIGQQENSEAILFALKFTHHELLKAEIFNRLGVRYDY
jgi:hypothetical protein